MTTPDPIAASVLRAIQAKGVTIVSLAVASGIHRDVIGRWLAGRRSIRLRDALRVASLVGLEVICTETIDGSSNDNAAAATNHAHGAGYSDRLA